MHVLKQNKTPVIFSKYCMVQSLGKEKKVGVYPAEKREKTLKKYFIITRYQTLLGPYIQVSFLKMAETTLLP